MNSGGSFPPVSSPPDAQFRNERTVALDIVTGQVVQQPAAPADQEEQPPARVMILLVGLEVLSESTNPFREDCNLDLG